MRHSGNQYLSRSAMSGTLLGIGLLTLTLAGCSPQPLTKQDATAPACGLVSPTLVKQAVPELPLEGSEGVGFIRDGDSISVDPGDAQGAQCTQVNATDSGNILDIRVTVPTQKNLDRLKADPSEPALVTNETCQPLEIDGASGSTCLIAGPSEQVVHAYSIWESHVISVDLSRSEGPAPEDRELVSAIAESINTHLK